MSEQVYVYPRGELTPRLSNGDLCGPKGAWSPNDRHLREMLRDGDVAIGDPPAAATETKKKGAKA